MSSSATYQIETCTETTCYHCGEDCDDKPIVLQNHAFCCEGCKTVYEILQQSELGEYYALEQSPGSKRAKANADKWKILESDTIRKKLIEFEDEQIARITFQIPQIHCSSCIWLLEHLHQLESSIVEVAVNFPRREASITYKKEEINLINVAVVLDSIGYGPSLHMATELEGSAPKDRSFFYKLGVAGFAFGNIMLLSLPEYFGLSETYDGSYSAFFSYLNLALALPVFFYCSSDYFKAAYHGIKNKFITVDLPIALGITALFARSSYDILTHTGAGYMDSLAGLVFFLLVGKWFQQKTYKAMSFERDYQSYFPMGVTKLSDDEEEVVPIRDVSVGDILLIRFGEVIPADATVVNGVGKIDYSFVTGEADPVTKATGEQVFAGGKQMGPPINVKVEKEVQQSYLTRLWNQDVFQKDDEEHLSTITDKISKHFTIGILFIAAATATYWGIFDSSQVWTTVTAVLIVACPCALALSMPFALGNVLRIFARSGIFVKNTQTVEAMAKLNHVVFDKTGTITHSGKSHIVFNGHAINDDDWQRIKAVTRASMHPLSQSISKWITKDTSAENIDQFNEIPAKGIEAEIGGKHLKIGSAKFVVGNTKSSSGQTQVYCSINGEIIGRFEFENSYRGGAAKVLKQLSHFFKLHLLSGDNDNERDRLQPFFADADHLRFNQSPVDKLEYVKALQDENQHVMMVGDGLNDAGALKQSDVGVAVSDDVHAFSPSCDVIMQGEKFEALDRILRFSRASLRIVKASFILSIIYNSIGLYFAVNGMLSPLVAAILMPLSSITVVLFVVLSTNILARRLKP